MRASGLVLTSGFLIILDHSAHARVDSSHVNSCEWPLFLVTADWPGAMDHENRCLSQCEYSFLYIVIPQWFRRAKNQDVNTRPVAHPFICSLAPHTHSLALPCSLRSRAPLCLFVRLLAHPLTPKLVEKWIF